MMPARGTGDPIEELRSRAASIEPLEADDGKSGARLERIVSGGRRYIAKHTSPRDDWLMRLSRDTALRPLVLWRSGLLHRLPEELAHAVVDVVDRDDGMVILMHDVGPWLVPEGDEPIPVRQHRGFLEHMAVLHEAFWGSAPVPGLLDLEGRYLVLSPARIVEELHRPEPIDIVRLIDEGWRLLPARAPDLWRVLQPLLEDPRPLVDTLRRTPQTLLHGDWKLGNLGTRPDGRTILLDWAIPGWGPACTDLAHYLALNAARLPTTQEATIDAYRDALERRGIATAGWWEQQLPLCLLGHLLLFAWEKALGDEDELAWWAERAAAAAQLLP